MLYLPFKNLDVSLNGGKNPSVIFLFWILGSSELYPGCIFMSLSHILWFLCCMSGLVEGPALLAIVG